MKEIFCALLFLLASILPARGQEESLVLATYTYATNNRLQSLEPLAAYLSAQTGRKVEAVSYPTVPALLTALREGRVDLAMMNTSGYLVLQRADPGVALPLVNLDMGNETQTNYGGCLIAARSAGIGSMDELKSASRRRTLALVAPSSTSGNLMPRLLLNRAGLPAAEQAFTVRYAGTHRGVVEEVLAGRAELGGCGCAEVDSARARGAFDGAALVIDSFHNIPLGPIVRHRSLDEKTTGAVRRALLRLHEKEPAVLAAFCAGWTEFKGARKFAPVADRDYDPFRKLFGGNASLWALIE